MIYFSFYIFDKKVFLNHLKIIYNRHTYVQKSMRTLSYIILEKLHSKLRFEYIFFRCLGKYKMAYWNILFLEMF